MDARRPTCRIAVIVLAIVVASALAPMVAGAQASKDTLSDITAEAIRRWFDYRDLDLWGDVYERFFQKAMASTDGGYSAVAIGYELVSRSRDFYQSGGTDGLYASLGYSIRGIGPSWLRLDIDASAFLKTSMIDTKLFPGGGFLAPVVDNVDDGYYKPSFVRYTLGASALFLGVLRLGYDAIGYTEAYKDFLGGDRLSTDLSGISSHHVRADIVRIDRALASLPWFSALEGAAREVVRRFAFMNKLFLAADGLPVALGSAVYTGLPILPLVGATWLPAREDLLVDASFLVPLGFSTCLADIGFSTAGRYVYKWSVIIDFLGAAVFGGEATSVACERFIDDLDAGDLQGGKFFMVMGPRLSFFDYGGEAEAIFPYREDIFFNRGFDFGVTAKLMVHYDKGSLSLNGDIGFAPIVMGIFPDNDFMEHFFARTLHGTLSLTFFWR